MRMGANTSAGRRAVAGRLARLALAGLSAWAAGVALLPGLAEAGETETFGVAPHPKVIEGERRTSFLLPDASGSTVRDAIRVYNKSTERIRLRIYGADAARSEDGSLSVAPFGARAEGLGAAIRVAVSDLTLPPKSERIVDFSVDLPGRRRGGLAAIVTEQVAERAGGHGALDLVTRVALLVKPGSGAASGPSIEGVGMDVPWVLVPRTATFEARVNNPGGNPVTVKLRARVATLTGRSFQLPEQEVRLGPGERRTVRIPWNEVPRWGGLMRTSATISWAGGTLARASGFQPIFPLWLIGGLNALLLLVATGRGIASARARRAARLRAAPEPRPAPAKAAKAQAAGSSRDAGRAKARETRSRQRVEAGGQQDPATARASRRGGAATKAAKRSAVEGAPPRGSRGDILPARGR